MRRTPFWRLLWWTGCFLTIASASAQTAQLSGGLVFDGETFAPRDVFVQDGRFVAKLPAVADTVLDVSGQYLVPPYGDFHSHILDAPATADASAARYVREGTFYVLNATASPAGYLQTRQRFAEPGSLDAQFAVAVTSTYSHPQILIESLFRQYWAYFRRALTPEQLETVRTDRVAEGKGYWLADDLSALDSVWAQVLAQRPDAVKVYLSDVAAGLAQGDMGGHGLHPDVLADVVRRAHGAGLRVLAHVETADDVRIAVERDVDALMHLPGYRTVGLPDSAWDAEQAEGWARYRLGERTIRRMAAQGTVVNPTLHLNAQRAEWHPDGLERLDAARRLQFEQVRRLHSAGVPIVVGLDGSDGTTWAEADYMSTHALFGPAEVLRAWATATPQAIFPSRQIGEIRPGYEASALVLACDPLADFDCAQRIAHRIKDGVVLPPVPDADVPND